MELQIFIIFLGMSVSFAQYKGPDIFGGPTTMGLNFGNPTAGPATFGSVDPFCITALCPTIDFCMDGSLPIHPTGDCCESCPNDGKC